MLRTTMLALVSLGLSAPAATPVPAAAAPTVVSVGLERLDTPAAAVLAHKRVGLILNAASVTRTGVSSVAALRAHGVNVRRLFTPEHGLNGSAGAGVGQSGGVDPKSGLPVVSLYGDHTQPTAADLAGLDALVFDLQDVGVRFFTYVSTEIEAMHAVAQAGIPFVVLDRPNPLGGEMVAGPVGELPRSFVNVAPGPLVHGLTAGEMARYVNAHSSPRAKLTVVPMSGWSRSMTWAQTGRRWIAPSPNLRSPAAALLYPGVALLEGTNVSEGRGTTAPFQVVCAPWLDAGSVVRALRSPALQLRTVSVIPRGSAAAPDPKFEGARCRGVRIDVARQDVNGFRVGLALVRAVRRSPRFAFSASEFDTLVGTSRLRRSLQAGATVASIVASEAAGVRAWRVARRSALLYPEAATSSSG